MKSLLFLLIFTFGIFADNYTIIVKDIPTLGDVDVNEHSLVYSHTDTSDITMATLDSFTIVVKDDAGNNSDNTPVYVLIIPAYKPDLFIVPNPLEIIGGNVKALHDDIFDNFSEYYFPIKEGSAIVLLADSLYDIGLDSWGRVDIFDAVGNNLAKNLTMKFSRSSNNTIVGICVWNGRNLNGRIVGSSAYVAYIELHLTLTATSDYNLLDEYNKVHTKVIGVRTR